ncbi:hypothetical protein GCM10023224_33560 [Streptomonospora halophila]|uniref:Uncharacterized protein n=1 Tax=Streptomonospora halophila TaxID=427369 RepID=A0ABP9GLB2_9ACTN
MINATASMIAVLSDARPHAISLTLGQVTCGDLDRRPDAAPPTEVWEPTPSDRRVCDMGLDIPARNGGFDRIRNVCIMCSVLSHDSWAGLRHVCALGGRARRSVWIGWERVRQGAGDMGAAASPG